MTDLVDFLLARIDDDEHLARRAVPGPWTALAANEGRDGFDVVAIQVDRTRFDVAYDHSSEPREGACPAGTAAYLVAFDPSRALVESDAKRRIVEHERGPKLEKDFRVHVDPVDTPVLRLLAVRYADHPDYLSDWRP